MAQKHLHLHEFNPDWDHAVRHGHAHRTGIVNQDTTNAGGDLFCSCCGEPIAKEKVDLWVHSKELEFLGFGFPLFYEFLKYCIILLIVSIGCYNALSLQQAIADNYAFCHPYTKTAGSATPATETTTTTTNYAQVAQKCYTFMIEMARIEEGETSEELTLRCVSFAVHLLALIYIRNMITKLQMYYDQRTTTLSDFSIVIKGIDKPEGGVRKSILTFLAKEVGDDIPVVEEIIILPHFQKIQELKQERKKIIEELRPYYSGKEIKDQEKFKFLEKKLEDINHMFITTANQSFEQIKKDELGCERAILVMNTEQDKEKVIKVFSNKKKEDLRKYFGNYCHLRVDEAPNPEEIIWENFNLPKKKRIIRVILGWILSIIVLVAVFVVFYFVLVQKSNLLEHAGELLAEHPTDPGYQSQYNGAVALVFVLMFLVVLFDKIVLATLFHKFTEWELPSTSATLQFSFALKLALGLFFTTALMTLATEAIKFQNYYGHPYGVVDEETIMFFMNSFFVPFFWLVNPMRIIKLIKRKCMKGRKDMTQDEANKLMEEQAYDLGKRFAEVIETIWFAFLYLTLIPVGAVIVVFGLTLYYWIDKYNLLRRSKIHGKVSGAFMRTSLFLLDITLILRVIGSIIFDLHLRDQSYKTSNIVLICIAFVYIVFPKHPLIKFFNNEKFHLERRTYREVKHLFHSNYHTSHPLFGILNQHQIEKELLVHKVRSINSMTSQKYEPKGKSFQRPSSLQSGVDLLKDSA